MQLNSESINEIASALAKAQGMMKTPVKDKVNPHFKNKYASLGSILSACKDALNANGLSITQPVLENGDKTTVVTTLSHSSGQWFRSYMNLRIDGKSTPQQMGSALTYARRYSLCALLGVDADEFDDDGELASQPLPQKKEATKKELLSQEMINDLMSKLMEDDQIAAVNFCKKNFGTEDLRHLSKASYDSMMKRALEKLNAETDDEG